MMMLFLTVLAFAIVILALFVGFHLGKTHCANECMTEGVFTVSGIEYSCIGYYNKNDPNAGMPDVLLPPDNGAFAPNTLDKLKFLRPTERQTLETKPIFSQGKQYDCSQCYRDAKTLPLSMVVCDTCGNKRCPKALNHRFVCTNSNALNQIGTLAEV